MTEPTVNAASVAKPPAKVPNVIEVLVAVPVGYMLPKGEAVTRSFDVTVRAGARWLQDWTAPKIFVDAFRFLPNGDSIGFIGERSLVMPVPEKIAALVPFHGHELEPESVKLLADLGLAPPEKPEKLEDMIPRPATRPMVH